MTAPNLSAMLGLTTLFLVEVGGISLGGWAKCSGLSVEFKYAQVHEGGNYEYLTVLPDQIDYKLITLERAMSMPGLDAAIGVGVGVAAVMGARIPAMLRCTTPPSIGLVLFDFNPDKITMSRGSRTATVPTPPRSGAGALTGRSQSSRTPTK